MPLKRLRAETGCFLHGPVQKSYIFPHLEERGRARQSSPLSFLGRGSNFNHRSLMSTLLTTITHKNRRGERLVHWDRVAIWMGFVLFAIVTISLIVSL